jgi:nicotinamidase-related amidase
MINELASIFDRSPELMSADDTALLVVDVQEKLAPLIPDSSTIVWNIERLLAAANVLGLPSFATEQYPKGLGDTLPRLADKVTPRFAKLTFSSAGSRECMQHLSQLNVFRVLVCGIESHVCIQQTALDLLAGGWRVYVPADAVGSRRTIDHDFALRRIDASGGVITTTEAVLFEWCRAAGTDGFKEISRLVRQSESEAGLP